MFMILTSATSESVAVWGPLPGATVETVGGSAASDGSIFASASEQYGGCSGDLPPPSDHPFGPSFCIGRDEPSEVGR
jgi:hypothetical protein